MERDLLVMIYGAIMGVLGSLVTSIVTALFHFWLERREYERRKSCDSYFTYGFGVGSSGSRMRMRSGSTKTCPALDMIGTGMWFPSR